ncbi:MAG: peptidoglycan DD-metalloendopeptidase family protein [Erysipelotrichales bacterium]
MKKKISAILIFVLLIGINSVEAQIDFKKDYRYYEKTCSNRTGYGANKDACTKFDEYKAKKANKTTTKMEKSLTDTNLTADKLVHLIQESDKVIAKREKEIENNKKNIKENALKVDRLEKDVIAGLSSMQATTDQNQVIDVIMASSSLEDLMLKIDGLRNFNSMYMDNILDLEKTTKSLEDEKKFLTNDIKSLEKTRKKQQEMLREFRRKEANLYSGINSGGSGASYNSALDKVDLSKINDKSKGWGKPTRHANISAGTWYYPGGGWHPGVDFATPTGSKVTAPANGVLLGSSTSASGYGKHVVAAFKKGDYVYTMIFAHLSDFVGVADFKKGDAIAITGNTGASTGPHVHVEVFRHNTDDLKVVVNQFKSQKDYWFGLGYSGKGSSDKVQRLKPEEVFGVRIGQNY